MTENQPLHVVAAIFLDDGKALACRRASNKSSAGKWEFPGGKVDQGESPEEALRREVREELGFECQVLLTYDISDTVVGSDVIRLETLLCLMTDPENLQSSDHDQFAWVSSNEAEKLDWASPDLPAVLRLIGEGII